jgi:hypothetical protein
MKRLSIPLAVLALGALAVAAPTQAVEWTSLTRNAMSFLGVSTPTESAFDSDISSLNTDGAYSISVAADTSIVGVAGNSQVSHESTIEPNRIQGAATIQTATFVSDPEGFADVFGGSHLTAYFDLTEATPYTLTGFITRGGSASAQVYLFQGSSGFLFDVTPGADQTALLDQSGTLPPDSYIFSVNVGGYAQEAEGFHSTVSGEWSVDFRLGGATAAPVLAGNAPLRVFPNPARDVATISLAAPQRTTSVEIHDLAGRLVRSLDAAVDGARWDTRDATGRRVPSGVYFVRVHMGDSVESGRVTVVR